MINTMKLAALLLLALQLHELPSAAGFSTPPSLSLSSRAIIASNGVNNSNCAAASSFSATRPMSLHQRGCRQRSGGGLLRMSDGSEAAAAAVPPAKSGFFEKVNLIIES
mgnify:CR=1 FL=1